MASVGPLPPSSWQVKRKRDEEVDTLNDHLDSSPSSHDASPPPDFSAKRPRTVGPNLPPASLEEKAGGGQDENSDTSSDDDDFGPSLPVAGPSTAASAASSVQTPTEAGPQVSSKSQRDDWMIIPPSNSDWSARVDPTKLKARKFNTGRGANAQAPGATPAGENKWTETAAEKRARLEREMMGITDPPVAKPTAISQESTKVAATTQKIKEYRVSKVMASWSYPTLTA